MQLKKQFELVKINQNIDALTNVNDLRIAAKQFAQLYLVTKELAEDEMLRSVSRLPASK